MVTGLADALFTATQRRLLSLLFGQPERTFFTRELIALAGVGAGGVQRELGRLADAGLVLQTSVGNQRHYRANPSSPIFEELCSIVRKILGVRAEVLGVLSPVLDELLDAWIYGSVARGEDRAGSDIDLLVVSDSLELERLFALLAPVEERLRRRISPTLYSDREFQRRLSQPGSFVAKVLAGPVLTVVERTHDEGRS